MRRVEPQDIWSASLSDVGEVRNENQDCCGETVRGDGARLLVVADGMGGHAAGSTASRLAVQVILEIFSASREPAEATLRYALEEANRRIWKLARERPELAGMGTTAVVLLFEPDGHVWLANVGDSRVYRLRDGVLAQLSRDHSWVAEMQRKGLLEPQEAAVHPRRNELTRSVGVEPELDVDVDPVLVEPGDTFLLCSDGLWGPVANDELAEVLVREDPERAVRSLLALAKSRGAPDNVTVQIASVRGGGADAPTLEEPVPVVPGGIDPAEKLRRGSRIRTIAAAAACVALLLMAVLAWLAVGVAEGPGPEGTVVAPDAASEASESSAGG